MVVPLVSAPRREISISPTLERAGVAEPSLMESGLAGPLMDSCAHSRAAGVCREGGLTESRASYGVKRVTAPTHRPRVGQPTGSRRHVVGIVAAVALQQEVVPTVIYGRV